MACKGAYATPRHSRSPYLAPDSQFPFLTRPSNPCCAVFFDDLWSNKKYADDVGIPFEKVDPDYGVSVTNVKDGIDKVRKGCACGVG